MLLFIELPGWLSTFLTTCWSVIQPVVITALPVLLALVFSKIKAYLSKNEAKEQAMIDILEAIAAKENNIGQLEQQAQEIKSLKDGVVYLGSILYEAYQNSSLDSDVKNSIASLFDKLKYGSTESLVAQLEEEKQKLAAQLEALTKKLAEKVVVEGGETVKATRVRK